jgi:hypothetical protein
MGLMQWLFGETKAENHVNNVISVTNSIVASTVQRCINQTDISQVINVSSGCQLVNSRINMSAKTISNMKCVQTAIHDLSSDVGVQNQIAQVAQALAQGLGLTAAQSKNVVSSTINLSNAIFSQIEQAVTQSSSIAQVVNCSSGTINGTYIDMAAEIGVDGSGVQSASTVVQAKTDLRNLVSQYAKAESKDIFALLANMGSMAIIAVAVVAAIVGSVFILSGGMAIKGIGGAVASPALWAGLCIVWLVVDGLLYSKEIWPYSKNVPTVDGKLDPKITKRNRTVFMATELPVALLAVGVGAWFIYSMYSARKKGLGSPSTATGSSAFAALASAMSMSAPSEKD